MTFDEMKFQYDRYHAFDSYVTVEHAKIIGVIPEAWHAFFPDTCKCGSENIVTMSLTSLLCVDPRCPCKQALGLSELFSRFGCVGVGEATCADLYKMANTLNEIKIANGEEPLLYSKSYVEILGINSSEYPVSYRTSAIFNVIMHSIASILRSKFTFPDLVSRLGLPEMGSSAFKLFNGINSFDELTKALDDAGGVSNFCESRHCYDPMKKYWLSISLEDIGVAACLFGQTIRRAGKTVEEICITGSCYVNGSRLTKKAFIDLCNQHGYSRPIAELVTQAVDESEMYDISVIEALNETYNTGLSSVTMSGRDIIEHLKNTESVQVPLIEVQMSSAKMSVPYIVADIPSNSSKYLAGLSRGVERNYDGSERKVLITSEEYLSVIDDRVRVWESEVINQCKSLIEKTNNQISKNSMSLKNSTSSNQIKQLESF